MRIKVTAEAFQSVPITLPHSVLCYSPTCFPSLTTVLSVPIRLSISCNHVSVWFSKCISMHEFMYVCFIYFRSSWIFLVFCTLFCAGRSLQKESRTDIKGNFYLSSMSRRGEEKGRGRVQYFVSPVFLETSRYNQHRLRSNLIRYSLGRRKSQNS